MKTIWFGKRPINIDDRFDESKITPVINEFLIENSEKSRSESYLKLGMHSLSRELKGWLWERDFPVYEVIVTPGNVLAYFNVSIVWDECTHYVNDVSDKVYNVLRGR